MPATGKTWNDTALNECLCTEAMNSVYDLGQAIFANYFFNGSNTPYYTQDSARLMTIDIFKNYGCPNQGLNTIYPPYDDKLTVNPETIIIKSDISLALNFYDGGAETACGETPSQEDMPLYTDLNGTFFYTNSDHSTPFNGEDKWWYCTGPAFSIQIDAEGQRIDICYP